MSLISIKNKIERRLKHTQNKNEYQEIGTYIKKRRKELNITQDVVSHGICSVSYLSKIENNQIAPNEFFIKEIMTKLDVTEDVTNTFLNDEHYLRDIIEAFFYYDEVTLNQKFHEIESLESGILFNLGELIYSINNQSLNSFIIISKLEHLIPNMNDFELKTFLVFDGLFQFLKENYKAAFELFDLIEIIHYNNDYLDGIFNMYAYITKQRLHKKNISLNNYELAQKIFSKYLNRKRSQILLLERIKYIQEEDVHLAELHISKIYSEQLDNQAKCSYYALYSSILIEMKKYQEAIIKLNNIKEDSACYYQKLVLLYKIALIENDLEMKKELESIISNSDYNVHNQKYRIMYHTLRLQCKEKKKEYLRDIAIPYTIKSSDLVSLKRYTDNLMEICMDNSRYKEATQYYLKYSKEIGKINELLR